MKPRLRNFGRKFFYITGLLRRVIRTAIVYSYWHKSSVFFFMQLRIHVTQTSFLISKKRGKAMRFYLKQLLIINKQSLMRNLLKKSSPASSSSSIQLFWKGFHCNNLDDPCSHQINFTVKIFWVLFFFTKTFFSFFWT